MDTVRAKAYLERIGLSPSGSPDSATPSPAMLTSLMRAHLRTVPFENLSIHLGEPIELTEEALLAKLVDRRRGGFCYELNGAFALLLGQLGYEVAMLQARVHDKDGLGPPYDHLTLRVELDEPWLVDVGFGRFLAQPVRYGVSEVQRDAGGDVAFTVVPGPAGYAAPADLDVLLDGVPQFRIDPRARELDEFRATCWYQQTYPSSHFRTSLVCSLPTDNGRLTLSDRTLVETLGDTRTERLLTSDDEVLSVYRERFGVHLDRLPEAPPPAGETMAEGPELGGAG